MAPATRSKAVIELGKKLVRELGDEGDRDLLAVWMAHFIAEKIDRVEGALPADRDRAQSECAAAILALWAHRDALPAGSRPFEQLEPIARAIADLDPEHVGHRYYPAPRKAADEVPSGPEAQWLELAKGIDYTARLLVRLCLKSAARDALDKTQDWVSLAIEAGEERGMDIRIVAFLSGGEDQAAVAQSRIREELENRLARLESFVIASEALAAEIRTEIENLS